MALSRRKAARERSLANLRTGPPAKAGNELAAKHRGYGAVSEAERGEREAAVYEAMGASVPLRGADGGVPLPDEMAVGMLAQVLVRLERVSAWLNDCGWRDEKSGVPKPALELERRLRGEALDLARELGLTPRSRVALGLDLQRGETLAQQAAEDHRREREGSDGG